MSIFDQLKEDLKMAFFNGTKCKIRFIHGEISSDLANQCHGALGSIRRCGKRLPPLLAFLAFHPTSTTKLNKYNFGDEVVL